jgi:hypothetical protein
MYIKFSSLLIFSLAVLSLGTTSCLMNYGVYDDVPDKPSKNQQIHSAISDYTKNRIQERGTYRGFLFGELFVTKVQEIQELDQLIEIRNQLPLMEEHYGKRLDSVITAQDNLIAAKKIEIKDKNLYPLYEISHLFSVAIGEKEFEVYEFDYSLFPNYTVKDVRQLMVVQLNADQYKQFLHLMEQKPLTDNYQIDVTYYTQFFTALDNEKIYKPELLLNIFKIMQHILQHGSFDQHVFCKKLTEEWMKDNKPYSDYKSLGYNPKDLQPVIVKFEDQVDRIIGYKLTHQFQYKQGNETFVSELNFEFDLNFLLIRAYL